jgi:hypothetical protein
MKQIAALSTHKDNANEHNESLLSNCRVQLIFYKDNANEYNESLLSNCRVQLIFYKDTKIYADGIFF